jgi:hypothetical protein
MFQALRSTRLGWLEEQIAERQPQDEWQAAKQFLDYL